MDLAGWFRGRIDATQYIGGVGLGDLFAITLFVVLGQYQHGANPIARPAGVLEAAVPFYVAWILVALVAGLYTFESVLSPRRAAAWAIPAWIVAVLISLPIRILLIPGGASPVFALVSLVAGGILVVGWRAVVPVLTGYL